MGRVLRFAVGGALLVAPLAVGCGGGSATEEHTVNEPAHVNEPAEAPPAEEAPAEEAPAEEPAP